MPLRATRALVELKGTSLVVRTLNTSEAFAFLRGFFTVFGVTPAMGRAFTKAEDTPGSEQVAILSDGLWRRQFGAQPDIVGKTLSFNDQPVAIVGIMPSGFRFDGEADLFIPMRAQPGSNVDPNAEVVGRLKRGVTLEHARSEMNLIAEQFRSAFPQQMRDGEGVAVRPYHEMLANPLKKYLWMLIGAVTFLLLIACANVANLQLARAASRQREFAVRRALGAREGRIGRQLLTEGMLLALIGGMSGTILAIWGKDLLLAGLPENVMPRLMSEATVDWRVLLCALAATTVTGLIFGLAPAWQARRVKCTAH
jgi:predicted permease